MKILWRRSCWPQMVERVRLGQSERRGGFDFHKREKKFLVATYDFGNAAYSCSYCI